MKEYVIRGGSLLEKVGKTNSEQYDLLMCRGWYNDDRELIDFIKENGDIFYMNSELKKRLCLFDSQIAEKIIVID